MHIIYTYIYIYMYILCTYIYICIYIIHIYIHIYIYIYIYIIRAIASFFPTKRLKTRIAFCVKIYSGRFFFLGRREVGWGWGYVCVEGLSETP